MMDANDTTRLAQQFLELWQREMSRQMNNPETLSAMLQAMQAFTHGNKETANDDAPRRPAPASDAEHDEIRQLSLRVSTLERELVKLRQRLEKSVPAKKPTGKKHRSPPAVVAKSKRAAKRGRKRVGKRVVRRAKPGRKPRK